MELTSQRTALLSMPGYRPNEYRLVLDPHEALRDKIQEVRQLFSKEFKIENSITGRANIPLVSFTQYVMMEERIIHRLQHIAMGTTPFKMELKDYGGFPSHTVFINVTTKEPFQNLVKQIRSEGQKLMKFDDEHKPYFMLDPSITIARKLLPWQYEKGYLKLTHKEFTGRFNADAMLLLKRPFGTKDKWQIAKRFDFENMPVNTTQGALF